MLFQLPSPKLLRLAKEGGWVVFGQFATALGALAQVKILTKYLEPAQYGQLTLGLTVAALMNQVAIGGIVAAVGRYFSIAMEKDDIIGYSRAARQLMARATAVVSIVAILLIVSLNWLQYYQWLAMVAAVAIYSIFSGYNASISSLQNAARHRAVVALHSGLDAWLKIALSLGIMSWFGQTGVAAAVGIALSALLVTSSQLFFSRKIFAPSAQGSVAKANWLSPMWQYAWPFSAWGIFSWAQQVSDRWALHNFGDIDEVGLYGVLFQLGYAPIGVLNGIVVAFLGPILYQRVGSARDVDRNASAHQLTLRITWICLGITAFTAVIAAFFHVWIFEILASPNYTSVSNLLPWVILAGGIFSAGQILALQLMSEMNPAVMTTTKIATSILGLIMNVFGSALFGISGVVASLVGFSAVYFAGMAWLARNLCGANQSSQS